MKNRILLLILFFISLKSFGQVMFQKVISVGVDSLCFVSAAQQTTDGGYIIGGSNAFDYEGLDAPYLIKTNDYGEVLWAKSFFTTNSLNYGNSVQQTFDGGYIIAGISGYYDSYYVVKTDLNGDTLWTRTYGGQYNDRPYYI